MMGNMVCGENWNKWLTLEWHGIRDSLWDISLTELNLRSLVCPSWRMGQRWTFIWIQVVQASLLSSWNTFCSGCKSSNECYHLPNMWMAAEMAW
jgi:hypothetical protein